MKKSQLRSIIREEIIYTLKESFADEHGGPFLNEKDENPFEGDEEIAQHIKKTGEDALEKATPKDTDEKKDIKSLLKGVKEDIDKATSLENAKDIIRQFMTDMQMDVDKRYKSEKIMLRSLLEDKYFSQFIRHFYNLILKFEGLGSPDSGKNKGGSYSGDEWGNANPTKPKTSPGGAGNVNFDNITIPKRSK